MNLLIGKSFLEEKTVVMKRKPKQAGKVRNSKIPSKRVPKKGLPENRLK
jgi:hypothetical protein